MSPSPRRPLALGAALLALVLCSGCGKESSTAPTSGSGSDALVNSADSVLALVLYDELNSPAPQRPSNVDFTTPYQYYDQAYRSPNLTAAGRVRARFGLAVLGLLILTSDVEVNAAFDEWKAYLETRVPFEITPSPRAPLGIPAGFTSAGQALQLPFDVVPLSLVSFARSPLVADPQIVRVQAILRERVLPRLTEAITHLDAVAADAGFTFVVTPAMQGDPAADPVEIDHTDILALRAACKLLSSACRVAVAYVLNFPAYDEASLLAAIQPGSSWLGLTGDGAGQMQLARLDLLGSLDDVSAAIGSLLTETDSQNDDVIRVGPGGASQRSLDSLRTRLPQVRQALESGYTLTANWDGNPVTPDVPLTLRPGALFTNPVPDWKAMLPAYTGSTERQSLGRVPVYNYNVPVKATINADTAITYTTGDYWLSVYPGGTYDYGSGHPWVVEGLRNAVQARFATIAALPDWTGDYYASCSFQGGLTVGVHSVQVPISFEYYSLAGRVVAVPVITWVATQYSEWNWLDPTFRGLLPGMSSTSQLLTTFGFGANQWERRVVLDWTRFGSGLSPGGGPPPPPAPPLRSRGPLATNRGGR